MIAKFCLLFLHLRIVVVVVVFGTHDMEVFADSAKKESGLQLGPCLLTLNGVMKNLLIVLIMIVSADL